MEMSDAIQRVKNEMSERGLIERVSLPENEKLINFYFQMLYAIGFDEGRKQGTHRMAVAQYDMKGNFIKIFGSVTVAAKAVNRNKSAISKAAAGKTSYSGGFKWKFAIDKKDGTSKDSR